MNIFLIALALFLGLAGAVFQTEATFGFWLVGFGCLLAILARFGQSERQNRLVERALKDLANRLPAPEEPGPAPERTFREHE